MRFRLYAITNSEELKKFVKRIITLYKSQVDGKFTSKSNKKASYR